MLLACSPKHIKNTTIEDTPEHRNILAVVEMYRSAVEQRDLISLKQVISDRYYENASTTEHAQDDYGTDEVLVRIMPMLSEHVDKIFYEIEVTDIIQEEELMLVDYSYVLKFRYSDGENIKWGLKRDVNQLALEQKERGWLIVSGL